MRHEGIRVLISTQSPLALPSELMELVSITILHQFQSQDWYKYMLSKIPLPEDGFDIIRKLCVGQAMVVCTKMKYIYNTTHNSSNMMRNDNYADAHVCLRIRPRLTADFGNSKLSK